MESSRFDDEGDYEYEIFLTLSSARALANVILAEKRDSLRHSTTGFNENVVVGGNKLSNVRSFIILLYGEGLTSFSINNHSHLLGKKSKMKLSVVFVLENFELNLVLVLKSKAL